MVAAQPVSAPALPFGHPYYRYSVIPGGAHNREELEKALRSDPVAARHYADFVSKNAQVIELQQDQQYYVSYRVGDQIYWTRRPLTLRRGEKVLFDGVNYARARCGNRLTLVPHKPQVEQAAYEPDPKVFSAPVTVRASLKPEPMLELGPQLPLVLAASNPANPLENLMAPYTSTGASPGSETLDYVPTRHDRATLFAIDGLTPATMLPILYPNSTPVSPVPEPGFEVLLGLASMTLALAILRRVRRVLQTNIGGGQEARAQYD
jgi:hypothetical protein